MSSWAEGQDGGSFEGPPTFPAFGSARLILVSPSLSETVAKTGMILLAGEITSRAAVDYQKVVRDTIKHVGYDDSSKGESV